MIMMMMKMAWKRKRTIAVTLFDEKINGGSTGVVV